MVKKLSGYANREIEDFLELAFDIGVDLTRDLSVQDFYYSALKNIIEKLGWDYGEVWYVNNDTKQISHSGISFYFDQRFEKMYKSSQGMVWDFKKGIPGMAWANKRTIWLEHLNKYPLFTRKEISEELGILSGVAIPIRSYDYVEAVMFIFSLSSQPYDPLLMKLFDHLSQKIGLLSLSSRLEKDLVRQSLEIMKLQQMNFTTLDRILEYRDPYTVSHQQKVTRLVLKISKYLGCTFEMQKDLALGAQLHDIGKIAIPMEILNKPGRLLSQEFNLIKIHPTITEEIIHSLPCSDAVRRMAIEHHERLDGSGYPKGLTRDQISREAKILMVADVSSAIMEDRPYRKGLPVEVVFEELKTYRGIKYDEESVDAALHILEMNYKDQIHSL